jgi:hypothetical protein
LSTELDTVVIDTNNHTLQQLWRADMQIENRVDDLEQIVVQTTTIVNALESEQTDAA